MKNNIRILIWTYILFILFDGILRKWILPDFSNVIMVVKDALAAIIVLITVFHKQIKSIWATLSIILGCITFITTMIIGHQNILVAIWGCKILWFGIPICFAIQKYFEADDVLRISKIILYTTIANAAIMSIQFRSPGGAWINAIPGGETIAENLTNYAAIEMAGLIRPGGIFAATTQISLYCTLALGMIFFYIFQNKNLPPKHQVGKPLIIANIIAYIVIAITSVSRTIIFSSIAITGFILLLGGRRNKKRTLGFIVSIFFVFTLLQQIPIISRGIDNLNQRFEIASAAQKKTSSEDFFNRIVTYNISAVLNPRDFKGNPPPFFGFGQGMSSQIGGRLLGINKNSGFALAEWDGLIITLESGILLGIIIIFTRLGMVISKYKYIIYHLKKGNYFPLCCYGAFFIGFYLYTQWGNSFQLNFSVMVGGIFLASKKITQESSINHKQQ